MRWEKKKRDTHKVKGANISRGKVRGGGRKKKEKKKKAVKNLPRRVGERTFPFGRPCIHVDVFGRRCRGSPANPGGGGCAGVRAEGSRVGMMIAGSSTSG